jgi:microcystin-dependent protein
MLNEISVTRDKVLIDGYKHIDLPIGTIIMNAGDNGSTSFGSAFLLCDGSSCLPSAYDELFQVINYKYGRSGDNFLLPNFLDRFPLGLPSVDASGVTTDDPYKNTSLRQGGNTIIQENQFSHGHEKLTITYSGISEFYTATKCDDDSPQFDAWSKAENFSNTTTTIAPSSHDPPYYTLNYFIYTGKGTIG